MTDSRSFAAYSTPKLHAAYSANYFSTLTFESAVHLSYPVILLVGSIVTWEFCTEEPCTGMATLVLPGELVFDVKDLQPIIQEMEKQYANRKCSVRIQYHSSDQPATSPSPNLYHFAKICCFINIMNHNDAVSFAAKLYHHITMKPPVTLTNVVAFGKEHILCKIQGFHVTDFPLWKLGCLLDENWLEEDVLNALAELLYFRIAEKPDTAAFLFLPMSFFNDARQLYICSTATSIQLGFIGTSRATTPNTS
ncbi:hypothetical protein PAXINDRAFT_69699 [Paxillus involutus ATCC 200175]|nr:hypothetical protein PAXINDRAFT_69699 [Paxillus involutus ATCC 200175]